MYSKKSQEISFTQKIHLRKKPQNISLKIIRQYKYFKKSLKKNFPQKY